MRIIIEIDEQEQAPDIQTTTTGAETHSPRSAEAPSTAGIDAGPAPALGGRRAPRRRRRPRRGSVRGRPLIDDEDPADLSG